MDAQKAILYVKEKGSDLEIARLRTILFAREPEIGVVQPFLALPSSRGGFPLRMQADNPDTVDNTLIALWWLDELGMLSAPVGRSLQAQLDWPTADWEGSHMTWALDCLHRGSAGQCRVENYCRPGQEFP